ncbi:protein-L-isoaspartate O-methyltransferase [candidate division WWE3 bacterium CG10_big_fil_rev_8_21_14_0_10_32_10]|uniref:Protein-L-isoaspartate O-methyltransferase n=1 Tax=candidate division WWE3 bacterium CG10_big_fil_rev_8_21_14_0_10_32_10 TaxID=1975090 RepID=A0A2H0RB35_UNCKA|nr:MAG: protein-L-isoaspartate O-methyltransferase [candidate division WWE3 bacterium CG10_big_fil_rev_8_21_14_0_10_32_10]
MESNQELVQYLILRGILKTPQVIEAFRKIDRKDFTQDYNKNKAYKDYPLPIGEGQTISQPSTVAFMIELLQPRKGDKILDIGSGSGYTTALLSQISTEGKVYGVEKVLNLVKKGRYNLKKYDFKNSKIIKAKKIIGLPNKSPFNKILVSASAKEIPTELIKQLSNSGTMVIPIKNSIFKIKKFGGIIKKEEYKGFIFVPLVYEPQ